MCRALKISGGNNEASPILGSAPTCNRTKKADLHFYEKKDIKDEKE